MKDPRLDEHLVIHEVSVLIIAVTCGLIVMLVDSVAIGTLAAAAAAGLGHAMLRIPPLRRGINRLAYGFRGASR